MAIGNNNPSVAVNKYPKGISDSIPPPGFTRRASTVIDTRALFNLLTSGEDMSQFKEMISKSHRRELEMMASLLTFDSDYFTEIVGNKYGSRRVQRLLGKSDVVDAFICAAIVCSFLHIMTDKYASHVAVRAMVVFEEEKKKTLYGHTLHHALDLARDQYGCIALNEIITDGDDAYFRDHILDLVALNALYLSNDAYFRDHILDLVALNALYLSNDASGNFVVQHALKLNDLRCTYNISVSLRGHCVDLSFKRYGSYIVEKLLEKREEPMVEVVMEILDCEGDRLLRLARSEFGNFVVSKALKVTMEEMDTAYLFFALVNKLMPFLHLLHKSHGSNIANTLESLNSVRSY